VAGTEPVAAVETAPDGGVSVGGAEAAPAGADIVVAGTESVAAVEVVAGTESVAVVEAAPDGGVSVDGTGCTAVGPGKGAAPDTSRAGPGAGASISCASTGH
jgi:hypothetical protein